MFTNVGNDIYLSRGDTGKLSVTIGGSYLLTENDRVLLTVKDGPAPKIVIAVQTIANLAQFNFTNEMTKDLPAKDYRYDIRIIKNVVFDDDDNIVGGTDVDTPFKPALFRLLETVGDV